MLLLIDNYDSFVYNLARYFKPLGQATRVVRNDELTVDEIARMARSAIVLSPGPCAPDQAGCSLDVVRILGSQIPTLGICLGHQAIGQAYGGSVVRAAEPVHGRASSVYHDGQSLFAGLPSPLLAARYHSLIVDRGSLPADLQVVAWTADGTIMGLAHRSHPVVGLQFHPESILTEAGFPLLAGFLRLAGLPAANVLPGLDSEWIEREPEPVLPATPVTF